MKYIMLLLLICLSCSPNLIQPSSSISTKSTNLFTSGHDKNIMYQCHQEDVNSNLIWIECQFINTSSETHEACIRVLVLDDNHKQLEQSRIVCSNVMKSGETYENYASFTKAQRKNLLNKCGADTSRCSFLTKEYPRP